MKRIIMVGVAVGAAFALGACGPKATPKAAPSVAPSAAPPSAAPPAPSGSAAATSASAAPAPSASASTKPNQAPPSAGPNGGSPGFTAALKEWKNGANSSSATQGAYWTRAAADLESGLKTDQARTDEYSFAISQLKTLVKLPSGQQSSGQNVEFHLAVESLDSFFSTPGLYT